MFDVEVNTHPVSAAMASVDAALAAVAEVDPMFMTTAEKRQALLGLSGCIDRLEELRMRVLGAAGDVAADDGARDAAAWLAHHGRRDPRECRERLRLARSLDSHPATAEAVRAGRVNVDQAGVLLRAVDALPSEVDVDVRRQAEERLVEESSTFGPRQLRILGRRVLGVVAPKVGERIEEQQLEKEEAHAALATFLRSRRNGDGTTDLRIRVADRVCDRLMTYLHAYTSPRRDAARSQDDRRPYDQRLGAAFASFLEDVDPRRLPIHGGDATTVVVTIDLEVLRGGAGVAYVGDEPMSASEARRLACNAGIVPVVLGGPSQILDAGRRRRLFASIQRRTLAIRYPTCAAVGCDIPAAWCEAHHAGDTWAEGGRTDLADGMLLCPFHHHRAHDHRYRLESTSEGVRFYRRT